MSQLVTVIGSTTPPGRLRRAVLEALERLDHTTFTVIDLAEVTIGAADGRPTDALADDTSATVEAIAAAEAVLLATPVYRGSFTGSLKNLLDHVPVEALFAKPTAIVTMGATAHHYLGADRHLRDVLSFFGALVTPVSVYLTSADFSDGVPNAQAAYELDLLLANLLGLSARVSEAPPGPTPLAGRKPPSSPQPPSA
jgi:FMN reductase